MTEPAEIPASLEPVLKGDILRMHQEVADHPGSEFHFFPGREAAASRSSRTPDSPLDHQRNEGYSIIHENNRLIRCHTG
jgi:hypothetical protein